MVKIILGNIWRKSEGKRESNAPFTIEDKVKHSAVKWQLIVWNCPENKGKVENAWGFLWENHLGVGKLMFSGNIENVRPITWVILYVTWTISCSIDICGLVEGLKCLPHFLPCKSIH